MVVHSMKLKNLKLDGKIYSRKEDYNLDEKQTEQHKVPSHFLLQIRAQSRDTLKFLSGFNQPISWMETNKSSAINVETSSRASDYLPVATLNSIKSQCCVENQFKTALSHPANA